MPKCSQGPTKSEYRITSAGARGHTHTHSHTSHLLLPQLPPPSLFLYPPASPAFPECTKDMAISESAPSFSSTRSSLSDSFFSFGHIIQFMCFCLCLPSLEFKNHESKSCFSFVHCCLPRTLNSIWHLVNAQNICWTNKRLFILLISNIIHS